MTHRVSIRRARGPLSPPTITQSMPVRSSLPMGPISSACTRVAERRLQLNLIRILLVVIAGTVADFEHAVGASPHRQRAAIAVDGAPVAVLGEPAEQLPGLGLLITGAAHRCGITRPEPCPICERGQKSIIPRTEQRG
jgi:hypothetical protein